MSFISYAPTPGDDKCLGVATIEYNGPIVLRYRLVPNKTGGNFLAPPSCKVGDKYEDGFEIDSTRQKLQIEEMIRQRIKAHGMPSVNSPSPSVFSTQPSEVRPPEASWTPPEQSNLPF